MHKFLPQEEWIKTLYSVPFASVGIIRNEEGKILSVLRTYKPNWVAPGGVADEKESPEEALRREVKEEVGLDVKDVKCVCIAFIKKPFCSFHLMFDCGYITKEEEKKISIPKDELAEWKWLNPEDIIKQENTVGKMLKVHCENPNTLNYIEI